MERLLTPSKITAWLDCEHFLTLRNRVDDGEMPAPEVTYSSMARLLLDKGLTHEAACLADYRSQGLSVREVQERTKGESFSTWVARVTDTLDGDHDVIYQMPFVHDGVRGIADFLVRVTDEASGRSWYEPVDAKLARSSAKPGHLLQLCFYADALEAATGVPPAVVHIWLGSGEIESVRLDDVRPYWRRLRRQLVDVLAADRTGRETTPEPCTHCDFCEFSAVCDQQWRADDALHFVAHILRPDRVALEAAGVANMAALVHCDRRVEPIRPERQATLTTQARLQVIAREHPDDLPPVEFIGLGGEQSEPIGFALLPEPDDGDVIIDYEGHPFWTAESDLFFLFGLLTRGENGTWTYEDRWAHGKAAEGEQAGALIEYLANRREQYPGMHVYHYNHTERSALVRMASDHLVGEAQLTDLIQTGLFVDLLAVVRGAMQIGVESYGLKHVEVLTGYQRSHDIDAGASAVVAYETYMSNGDEQLLDKIARYNEDDVRATLALRDWLIGRRPPDLAWRAPVLEPDEADESEPSDTELLIEALHEFPPDSTEVLLGHLLGYWRREWLAASARMLAKTAQDLDAVLADPDVVTGLRFVERVDRVGKNGKPIRPVLRFEFPRQEIGRKLIPGAGQPPQVIFVAAESSSVTAGVAALDEDAGRIDLMWSARAEELGVLPQTVVLNDWVPSRPKPTALAALAGQVLDPVSLGAPNPASMALLRRDLPRFTPGHGPAGGVFDDHVPTIVEWAGHLDGSYVAIQGPPGTGKTYTGAHIIHRLIIDGKRVGISAMSHAAIDNLLAEVVEVFQEEGHLDRLSAVRRGTTPASGPLPNTKYVSNNPPCANRRYNLVAGTTWLFSGKELRGDPVDVLIIDEAGQLALADAVAAAGSAHNVILLGDPQQLAHVSQASHPGGSGDSVLEHILDGHPTIPADRGVFLSETRRMHPDVCGFISHQIYEDRLTSHATCAIQGTEAGTGLRWIRVEHSGCSTESVEEADVVVSSISSLIGQKWTNATGGEAALTTGDFMVVAPYNDQVAVIRAALDASPTTKRVRVGTVDKFQGQEAPVVFFTMTTSTDDDMPRGPEFLFSRNRLNVAISRARCLAYLVCTEDLLNSRARTVDDMKLISTLCAFAEQARQSDATWSLGGDSGVAVGSAAMRLGASELR